MTTQTATRATDFDTDTEPTAELRGCGRNLRRGNGGIPVSDT